MLSRMAVSNLAWPLEALPEAIRFARRVGLSGIELAPWALFGSWDARDDELLDLRNRIEGEGLVCPALQGILFNVGEVALFKSKQARINLADHLAKVARMAGLLGAGACVFGSPKQRDPGDLAEDEARKIAIDFFQTIGPVFAEHGTCLAIEANARAYACRFITTTAEAVDLVREIDTQGIRLQIDTGTIFLEGEEPSIIRAAAPFAAHAHVSEPQLQPLGSGEIDHRETGRALRNSGYSGFISIEMRAAEDWQAAVHRAAALLKEYYL